MTPLTTEHPPPDPEGFFAGSRWTLGVIGLGYVGLPLLVRAVEAGLGAIGFDVSADRIARLQAGDSPVEDVTADALRGALDGGAVFASEPGALAGADMIAVCVPSPLGHDREPDLTHIEQAAETLTGVVRPGNLVVLESTSYPGTTDDIVVPAVTAAGLEVDRDVWVAFSPERVSPGGPMPIGRIPKVVGGVSPASTAVAAAAYGRLVESVHPVSSARAAEMAKLLENTYRAVNIALANEMAQLAHALDIDVWEVIEAAATKPFGFEAFWPGPGVGGHCIPLDPRYLSWRARAADFATRFIDLAEQINRSMPRYTADRVEALVRSAGGDLDGARVLAVGAAYTANVADARESASLEVIEALGDAGAEVSVLDPVIGVERIEALGLAAVDPAGGVEGFDVAVILTDHDGVDYAGIADAVPLVLDARGAFRRRRIAAPNVTPL